MPETTLVTVTFKWSNKYGECYECGLPAAFVDVLDQKLCAVCAANRAADGEEIERIDRLDGTEV